MIDVTVIDALVEALRSAAIYDKNDQAAPCAVLWTDKSREWEVAVSQIGARLQVLTLGDYDSGRRRGPAIWMRVQLAESAERSLDGAENLIILYLPGVSREELRSVEDLPLLLQPLAELQYRGTWWSHPNGRDWTVAGFLGNAQKGLGLDLRDDAATARALHRALPRVLEEPLESLRGRRLEASDFDALLTPDTRRSVLLWVSDPDGFRAGRSQNEWDAFCSTCKSELGLNPQKDGVITAADRLGRRHGKWAAVWTRYAESPHSYPGVPVALDRARPHELVPEHPDSWPGINGEQEATLRADLESLADAQPAEARVRLAALEEKHGERRDWLWSNLGEAPLAQALKHLVALAEVAGEGWKQGDVEALSTAYAESGWRGDDALLRALASVDKADDLAAVKSAANVLYRVWLEQGARALQGALASELSVPGATSVPSDGAAGTCLLFTDGLRMDLGHRLADQLEAAGCRVELSASFTALPPVTATTKPAVAPIAGQLGPGADFDASPPESASKLTADGLRKLLKVAGWDVLEGGCGDASGRAWTECGDIDRFGHNQGSKVARSLDAEVSEIAERVLELIAWGWQRVVVVTDHGWLMVPGGLEKVELPEHLTEQRKGRCARLKPGASTSFLTLPWRWNEDIRIAFAPGISTFVAGQEFDHGGLSPQECIVPRLVVSGGQTMETAKVDIASISWSGMRCRVALSDARDGLVVDIRTNAAEPSSSVVLSPARVEAGAAAPMVEDDEKLGTAVCVVVLDESGTVVKQVTTLVGGDS